MRILRATLAIAISSAALVGCSSSPEVLNYEDGPVALSEAEVGDQFTLEHVALTYADGSDAVEVCYSVDETGMEAEDFLTQCGGADLYIPLPDGYDFEGEGFQRREPNLPPYPNGWDRVADATIEIIGADADIPEARIIELDPASRP